MGSTNKTAHYELPQFVANDKPSWLGDVNEAMEAIDTGIYGAKSSADGAQQTANNAVAGVASAGTRMDGIQTQLDTVATQANQTATTVAGHTSSIATNSANINTLNSRMGSTDISGIGDGTVTGAIASISGGGGSGASYPDYANLVQDGTGTVTSTEQTVHTTSSDEFVMLGFTGTGSGNAGMGVYINGVLTYYVFTPSGAINMRTPLYRLKSGDTVAVKITEGSWTRPTYTVNKCGARA